MTYTIFCISYISIGCIMFIFTIEGNVSKIPTYWSAEWLMLTVHLNAENDSFVNGK